MAEPKKRWSQKQIKGRRRPKRSTTARPNDIATSRSEDEVFHELSSLCALPGYIHALSYLIFRDCVVTAGEEFKKEDFQKLYTRNRLIRTEITALLGLWLKGERSLLLPDADTMQDMIDRTDQLLSELHGAMLAPARADFIEAVAAGKMGLDVESPLGRSAAMREAIFYSGESAFTFQYSEFARRRYENDREWLQTHYGFEIDVAAELIDKLIAYFSDMLMPRFENLRSKPSSEWTLLPLFSFTLEELAETSGVELPIVRRFVETFCIPLESKNPRYTSVFSFNEASVFPFVSIGNGSYVFLQEYVGAETLYNSPSYWMRNDPHYAPHASKNRGRFAEDFCEQLISRVFPANRVHKNVIFKRSKAHIAGEADAILVHGKRAFVFQLKSKGLTKSARSGNELAITRDFGAAVQGAYDQAVSCIDLMREGVGTFQGGIPYSIPHLRGVTEFYPVCITSENYPSLSFQVRQFLTKTDKPYIKDPIVMDLFTLDVITEFLRSPLYFTDYLAKRSLLFEKIASSHEMILLAFHLRGNLFVPDDVGLLLIEDDVLVEVDLAMAVRRRGLPGKDTPVGILTRNLENPLGRILKGVDETDRPEVHQLGELILNLSGEAWTTINRWTQKLAEQARMDEKNHDVTVPIDGDGIGLTIHCNNLPVSEAYDKLAAHCVIRKYIQKADKWFGVCISPSGEDVRFAIGQTEAWEFRPELEEEAAALKVRSVPHWVDVKGRRGKLSRNNPCPCGSGRKYKHCHLAN